MTKENAEVSTPSGWRFGRFRYLRLAPIAAEEAVERTPYIRIRSLLT